MHIKGWIERNGELLSHEEILTILTDNPMLISEFGGEFYLTWNSWRARDMMGIIPGDCPAGSIQHDGRREGSVKPSYPSLQLEDAIRIAIRLRSEEGVCALSGGVDSALVACLANRPCIAVGMPNSHDLKRARYVADILGLPLHTRTVTREEISGVLPIVLSLLQEPTPVDLAIATTLFFVAETAAELGYERILTGQGADEIFGGYSRYLNQSEEELKTLFTRDFASLSRQGSRDQAVAGYHNTYLSMPYLDPRVVCAASSIPPGEMIKDGVRKRPLREVAAHHIPRDIAYYEKKAMQYGTGIWKEIKHLARENGYQGSVSDYIHERRRI